MVPCLVLAEIPKTLLKEWHINSTLQLVIRGVEHKKGLLMATSDAGEKKDRYHLDAQMMVKWKRAIAGKETSRGRLSADSMELWAEVASLKKTTIHGKNFSSTDDHRGNSHVEFLFGHDQRFGTIKKIFNSSQTPGKTWMILMPWKELDKRDDPYHKYPDLNCRLVRDELESSVVVEKAKIIGHVAVLKNPAGTFGIAAKTITAVGLGTMVSFLAVHWFVPVY